jgi:hypothetical protein
VPWTHGVVAVLEVSKRGNVAPPRVDPHRTHQAWGIPHLCKNSLNRCLGPGQRQTGHHRLTQPSNQSPLALSSHTKDM